MKKEENGSERRFESKERKPGLEQKEMKIKERKRG